MQVIKEDKSEVYLTLVCCGSLLLTDTLKMAADVLSAIAKSSLH